MACLHRSTRLGVNSGWGQTTDLSGTWLWLKKLYQHGTLVDGAKHENLLFNFEPHPHGLVDKFVRQRRNKSSHLCFANKFSRSQHLFSGAMLVGTVKATRGSLGAGHSVSWTVSNCSAAWLKSLVLYSYSMGLGWEKRGGAANISGQIEAFEPDFGQLSFFFGPCLELVPILGFIKGGSPNRRFEGLLGFEPRPEGLARSLRERRISRLGICSSQ